MQDRDEDRSCTKLQIMTVCGGLSLMSVAPENINE